MIDRSEEREGRGIIREDKSKANFGVLLVGLAKAM
jgi:hypothetical protein